MTPSELRITLFDWLSVLLVGLLFSASLSLLGYFLLGLALMDGAFFGLTLGFFITLYSFVFITSMNRYLLPFVPKILWNAVAALFSFLSGFLAALSSYLLLRSAPIALIAQFESYPLQSAAIVGVLSYLVGALIYRFVKARNEKEKNEQLFTQSRLRSLETQLNPHFLFNALNSLAELIHQDPYKAEEALLKISAFLRNTMGERALISLGEELENVRAYIDLENIRFGGKIHLEINCEKPLLSRPLPKFSIQLLAENAIKHGMKSAINPFHIRVEVSQNTHLQIRVANNGKAVLANSFGIGLSNLQERLKHLCQGEVRLEQAFPVLYLITLKECCESADRR